jgi:hypothetical protein
LKRVIILAEAAEDIEAARDFYQAQEQGVGEYCVDSLLADVESLGLFSGIHPLHFEFHRMLASRFPFGILLSGTRRRDPGFRSARFASRSKLDSQRIEKAQ